MTTRQDIASLYTSVASLLRAEEEVRRPVSLADWQGQRARRAVLEQHVRQVEQAVADLRQRLEDLPALANAEQVYWAQAVLALPNLAFLEVDTDGLGSEADVLRIVLVDQAGAVLFDWLIQPRRPITPKIAHLTALAQEHLAQAPRLADIWKSVTQAFAGRYILSFNLEFDQQQLAANARRSGLAPLTFLGECLMLRVQAYSYAYHYPRLSALCERLGAPLPDHPRQDAIARARGQVHLLRMMAQGITHVPAGKQASEEAESAEGGDPFLPEFPDDLS